MGLVLDLVVILGLLKILVEFDRPFVCGAVYAAVSTLFSLLLGVGLFEVTIGGALLWAIVGGWFWLLTRFDTGSLPWWIVVIAGLSLRIGATFIVWL